MAEVDDSAIDVSGPHGRNGTGQDRQHGLVQVAETVLGPPGPYPAKSGNDPGKAAEGGVRQAVRQGVEPGCGCLRRSGVFLQVQ
ncbi:hypothetical protein D9M72_549670 [compost metagenome]